MVICARALRRLRFPTLLQDALEVEAWDIDGYDEMEEAAQDKIEALLHLHHFQNCLAATTTTMEKGHKPTTKVSINYLFIYFYATIYLV